MLVLEDCQGRLSHVNMVRDWSSYNCQSEDIISHLLQYNLHHVVLQIFRFVQKIYCPIKFQHLNDVTVCI